MQSANFLIGWFRNLEHGHFSNFIFFFTNLWFTIVLNYLTLANSIENLDIQRKRRYSLRFFFLEIFKFPFIDRNIKSRVSRKKTADLMSITRTV